MATTNAALDENNDQNARMLAALEAQGLTMKQILASVSTGSASNPAANVACSVATAPVVLLEARPRRAHDGSEVIVRLAGSGALHAYFYLGEHWTSGISRIPDIATRLDFSGVDLGTGSVPSVSDVEWAGTRPDLARLAGYVWTDAPVILRIGPEGIDPPVVLRGRALAASAPDGFQHCLAHQRRCLGFVEQVGGFVQRSLSRCIHGECGFAALGTDLLGL